MLLLTGFLVLLTAVYAWLTYRMLQASREAVAVSRDAVATMREQTAALYRPYITVTTFSAPEDRILYLRISNTGQSTAENLQLKLDRSFHVGRGQSAEFDLAEAGAFTRLIQSFPPGAELNFLLGGHDDLFGRDGKEEHPLSPWSFTISAQYSSLGKPLPEENTTVDLRQYQRSIPPSDTTVRELRHIRKAILEARTELRRLAAGRTSHTARDQ